MPLFSRLTTASLAFAALLSVPGVSGLTVGNTANLHLVSDTIAPDGYERDVTIIGTTSHSATFPGPVVRGQRGDRFRLNVIDELDNPAMHMEASVHWHGILQRNGQSWADGVDAVTQCPISPGHSFLYDFTVPDQAGTYWYHSHHSTQYCDGLRAVFILDDPNDPYKHQYDVDDESTIITISDWYHILSTQAGVHPTFDSTLINGVGRYFGGPEVDLAVITVRKGTRYRFRMVSTSCDPFWDFSIDNHTMTVIEADGEYTEALNVDQIPIFAGQRYSFILHADQEVDNYWVRANPNRGTRGFAGGINSAILRYIGAPDEEPTTPEVIPKNTLVEANLHNLHGGDVPGGSGPADTQLTFNFDFDGATNRFTVNNKTLKPIDSLPVLLQILSGTPPEKIVPQDGVYFLERNKTIEIVMPGGIPGSPHPMHLHGHTFDVVRSIGSTQYNYNNPVRRDVVSIGSLASDLATIRFRTDNPGPWIFHCHIDWHLDLGFAVVFAEATGDIPSVTHPSDQWKELCDIYDGEPEENFPNSNAAATHLPPGFGDETGGPENDDGEGVPGDTSGGDPPPDGQDVRVGGETGHPTGGLDGDDNAGV